MVSTRFSNTNNDDAQMDSLVTSITFVVIALHLQIAREYKHLGQGAVYPSGILRYSLSFRPSIFTAVFKESIDPLS